MAIMAIKLRKKVNWGQLSSAGHSNTFMSGLVAWRENGSRKITKILIR